MKIVSIAGLSALGIVLCGCASITEGTSQDISVVTNPSGASCVFERMGMNIGTIASTPATLNVPKRKYDIMIRCNKPGFQEATYLNHSGLTAVIAANVATDLLLTGGLSSIIDSSTGADNKYDSAVNMTLVPISASVQVPPAGTGGRIAMDAERAPMTLVSPITPVSLPPKKPSLGITGGTVNPYDSVPARQSDRHGAWVNGVIPDGAGAKAGIKRDDIIQTFNGHRIATFDELTTYTEETLPGDPVRLGVWRNGQIIVISAEFWPTSTGRHVIPLELSGGTYVVPTVINGVITLKFTVDSGSADVSIPADVFLTLVRAGTIGDNDYLDKRTYVLADGSKVPSQTFRIRSLKVGDVIMENVLGSVADVKGPLLLGQSFLGKLKSWSMDNSAHALIIN